MLVNVMKDQKDDGGNASKQVTDSIRIVDVKGSRHARPGTNIITDIDTYLRHHIEISVNTHHTTYTPLHKNERDHPARSNMRCLPAKDQCGVRSSLERSQSDDDVAKRWRTSWAIGIVPFTIYAELFDNFFQKSKEGRRGEREQRDNNHGRFSERTDTVSASPDLWTS